ncbi:MAG: hypothetical protein IK073_01280 [Paludibacteraceae bacterium]|nr:hypothetical protein [Paludibacteraceae bacterium]
MNEKRYKTQLLRLDRLLTGGLGRQIAWITALLLLVWLGIVLVLYIAIGDEWQGYCNDHHINPLLLPFYLLVDANAFSNMYFVDGKEQPAHGWLLFLSGVTYLIGLLIFNGIIISVLSNYFDQRRQDYHDGTSRYRMHDHYVIMGYDEMVPSVIDHIFRNDAEARILMLSAVESVKVRERLRKSVKREQMERIVVNYGHKTARDYYPDIYLEAAKEIFVVGKRSLPNHDAVNVECVESIFDYLAQHVDRRLPHRITCVFEDFDTYTAFKLADIFEKAKQLGINFVPYNFYEGWAKQVFIARRYYSCHDSRCYAYPAVWGPGIGYEDRHRVHLVFVGTSTFGVAFAMEAAHVLHFPNGTRKDARKTRISFIDLHADTEMELFRTRNRHFFEIQSCLYSDLTGSEPQSRTIPPTRYTGKDSDFLDIEFEFIKGDIYSPEVQNLLSTWAEDETEYVSIFLANTNQRDNFCLSMNMPDAVYERELPIFVRQDSVDTFVTELRDAHTQEGARLPYYLLDDDGQVRTTERQQRYANIYPFGMNGTAFYSNRVNLARAELLNHLYETADYAHYRFLPLEQLEAQDPQDVRKAAHDEWMPLKMALKWSNLYAAEIIPCKLDSMEALQREGRLDPKQLDACMAQLEHNRWNVEKLLMGYRKAHPQEDKYQTKDEDKKAMLAKNKKFHFAHHDIRPYDELDDVRLLDSEFTRYIPWIVRMVPDIEHPVKQ